MKTGETFEARHCPHCGVYAHFTHVQTEKFPHRRYPDYPSPNKGPMETSGHYIATYECSHCDVRVIYISHGKFIGRYLQDVKFEPSGWEQFYPKGNKRPVPPGTPQDVLKDFEEACAIESISANGASVMACRALQNMIRKHLDPSKHGKLYDELEEFSKTEGLSNELTEMAHVVRNFSNIARHPAQIGDTSTDVSSDEVAGILDFTQDILRYFYEELPQIKKRLADLQQRAGAKSQKAPKTGQP